jgi:muconolactone delta-isomerase
MTQYLVTMTTRVPDGTADAEVDRIRELEATRSRELAAAHQLLRLWRPPLLAGEWRTLGLFDATDVDELESILASMPLRIWRSDDVQPLAPHPNDPTVANIGRTAEGEFFTWFTVTVPSGVDQEAVDALAAREAEQIRQLAGEGHVTRLWMLPPTPGSWHALGLWRAADAASLGAMLRSLPMNSWMSVDTMPLTRHPSDPAP